MVWSCEGSGRGRWRDGGDSSHHFLHSKTSIVVAPSSWSLCELPSASKVEPFLPRNVPLPLNRFGWSIFGRGGSQARRVDVLHPRSWRSRRPRWAGVDWTSYKENGLGSHELLPLRVLCALLPAIRGRTFPSIFWFKTEALIFILKFVFFVWYGCFWFWFVDLRFSFWFCWHYLWVLIGIVTNSFVIVVVGCRMSVIWS